MCSTIVVNARGSSEEGREQTDATHTNRMSSKEQKEVAVEKIDNDKASGDAKCELKGTKRAAEVSGLM